MTIRSLLSVVGPAILAGFLILAVLAAIDVILYFLGTKFDLGFTAEVWGTYSSWGAALVPGIAIMASTQLWILDRRDRDRREVIAWASMLRRNNGANGADTTVFNGAPVAIEIVRTNGSGLREGSPVCQPGEKKYFLASVGQIYVRIASHEVRLREDGAVDYIGLTSVHQPST